MGEGQPFDVWDVATYDAGLRLIVEREGGLIRSYWNTSRQMFLEREAKRYAVRCSPPLLASFGERYLAFKGALADLYRYIDAYVRVHRPVLLGEARDPGTFFVKTAKSTSQDEAYGQSSFYEAWRLTIQRYGIYNPYTKRGAIKGLLPHGPHNVRDVLATHVLKETGSYEQAGYAIRDTADVVAQHYGRFLPENKVALAAKVINRVWMAA